MNKTFTGGSRHRGGPWWQCRQPQLLVVVHEKAAAAAVLQAGVAGLEAHISKIKKYSIIQLFKINKYLNKHINNNKDSITQKTLKKIKKQHSNKIQESKLRIKIRTTRLRI